MGSRGTRRALIASAALVAIGQLVTTLYVGMVGPSAIAETGRLVVGGLGALAIFAAAVALALFAWLRSRRTGQNRVAAWLLAAAVAAPAGNAIHRFWWPSSERLVRAAHAGDLSVVERCLLFRIDPSATGMVTHGFGGRGETETPLAAAAIGGHAEIVRRLLDAGADPLARESAALVAAVNSGRPEIADILVAAGSPLEGVLWNTLWQSPDPGGRRLEALRRLLATGVAIEPASLQLRAMFQDDNGFGVAFASVERDAVQHANPRIALLNAIALADAQRAVALYRMLRSELAQRPADPKQRARSLAEFTNVNDRSSRPLEQLHDEALLALAAKFGAAELIAALLADGVPSDPPDTRYDLPRSHLNYAAAAGQVEAARLLIAAGAHVARSDGSWGTPLHAAVSSQSGELIDLLIANGADPDAPQSPTNPTPPSHWAAFRGDLETIERLVANGGSLDAIGHDGRTIRKIAQRNHFEEIVGYLDRATD